jgi:hypothetical protein
MAQTSVRPILRICAGLICLCALGGIVFATLEVVDHPKKIPAYGFLVGQFWLSAFSGYAAVRGQVPNWLVNQK